MSEDKTESTVDNETQKAVEAKPEAKTKGNKKKGNTKTAKRVVGAPILEKGHVVIV